MKKFKRKEQKPAQKWYEGGTLHQASINTWHDRNTMALNALATACDFIFAARKLDNWTLPEPKTQDEVLELCKALVTALIQGSKPHLATVGHQRMADLVPVAMAMLGWLEKNEIPEEHILKEALSEHV